MSCVSVREIHKRTDNSIIKDMGKKLIIKDADFSRNAIDGQSQGTWVENSYTWGKGGITGAGQSSGSTNDTMSMIGLPLPQASEIMTFKASNGYLFQAYFTSDIPTPTNNQMEYVEYKNVPVSDIPGQIIIPSGKYFSFAVMRQDGTNADITEGHQALLILADSTPN